MNFRDLGGYVVASGDAVTRWRTLFRADGLGELTVGDFTVLRDLGIRTVIDLRAAYELERGQFDVASHPVSYHHIPFIESIPDPEEFDRRPDLLEAQYLEMLDNAGTEIRSALEVLAGPDALPAVFHCTAGKDRTGLLVGHPPAAARRGRGDGGGRLRAQPGGDGPAEGEDHPQVPRQRRHAQLD